MFRFTIRDVLGLMVVAAMACVVGPWVSPSYSGDPSASATASLILFSFGGACYVAGVFISRAGQKLSRND